MNLRRKRMLKQSNKMSKVNNIQINLVRPESLSRLCLQMILRRRKVQRRLESAKSWTTSGGGLSIWLM
jgi:hypothetical protein